MKGLKCLHGPLSIELIPSREHDDKILYDAYKIIYDASLMINVIGYVLMFR